MKKFKELLTSCIDESITGTTIEKLVRVKNIFESEMIYKNRVPSPELIEKWLRGIQGAINIPYAHEDILAWYELALKRKIQPRKSNKGMSESEKLLEKYWPQCARTLYEMLYM